MLRYRLPLLYIVWLNFLISSLYRIRIWSVIYSFHIASADKEISNALAIDNIIVIIFHCCKSNNQGSVVDSYSRQEHFEVLAKDKSWHHIAFSVSSVQSHSC